MSPRAIPAAPPAFRERFIRDGWRGVERLYGARTDCLLKWIEWNGGDRLYADRREYLRTGVVPPNFAG